MKITFFGAAQNVTGSKHLIETNGFRLLLDCGLYQGKRDESNQRNKELPFDAKTINAVVLSHAHLDHCGTLPTLVKNGFEGKIYCTGATARIANYILKDAAEIQKQDCRYINSHLEPGQEPVEPIYTKQDVESVLERFEETEYFRISQKWTELTPNLRFKLYDAGHILGSAVIVLEVTENGTPKTFAFTGDLGREYSPILRSPEKIEEGVGHLATECTYGDRTHRPQQEATGDLKEIIHTAVKNNSKIIIPAFSLGRTQEIIYILHKLVDEKQIPPLPIYIDSPLAENITDIFSEFTEYFDENFWQDFGNRKDSPFLLKNLKYIRTTEESKKINDLSGPFIVISASGMAEGGRVLHHLKANIGDPNNVVLIVGYQAEHTLGRKIQEGVSPVNIFGKPYDVRAKIITLQEFSAHADQTDLLAYIKNIKGLNEIFLVHTEVFPAETFKQILEQDMPHLKVQIPTQGQSFEI